MTGVASNQAIQGDLDLGSDRLYASLDPEPVWRDLVRRDAVVWTPPSETHGGFWSVFSHAACRTVLAAEAPFSSEYGMFIGFDREHPDSAGGRMIVVSEGDWHHHLRGVMGRYLSRMMAGPLLASLVAQARALLAELRASPVTDVAGRIATWLPNAVVCEVLGVPEGDREWLRELTHYAVGAPDHPAELSPSAAHARIMYYLADLVRQRQRRPGADLVSALLHEGGLSPSDVLVNCDNVFAAGNATTQHSVAATFHAFALTPGVLDRLRDDPRTVRTAVEEILRWSTPGPHVLRVAVDDVVLGGQRIRAGSAVVSWLAAANRDPRAFPEPDAFVVDRQPNRHLSFGSGPHYCLGAMTARAELKVLFELLAASAREVLLVGEPQRLRSTKVNGYRHLRVAFEWR